MVVFPDLFVRRRIIAARRAFCWRRGSQLRSGNAAVASEAGKIPEKDGEDNVYLTTPFQWNLLVERSVVLSQAGPAWARKSQAPVLFVNGIKGSGKKHCQQALMTSAFSGGPVLGFSTSRKAWARICFSA